MPATKPFFDTNVLLYLLSADAQKADRAESVVKNGGIISVQVLNELANVMRRKLAMTWQEVTEVLQPIRALCQIESLTAATHERGLQLAERHQLSIYDAMIVAAALIAGCDLLYSEDMHDGLVVEDQLRICNPFGTQ